MTERGMVALATGGGVLTQWTTSPACTERQRRAADQVHESAAVADPVE
ncbi:hypothetical protein [Streptomyces rhizosphaericus]|uniref:Uncharacterized protein n=1 Tax=Streptomyces rhizosphaericus TaxID=114699 RepID=A0A6G4AI28_9ACTN|nr:hypothetical protein [Streptomyces rhizosphaericus]NEW72902.1 hypothetical protein [Streptomyces rhizosphaericus]